VKTHAPKNPTTKPISGLSMANQSEITSPEAGKSRLRAREGALVTGKNLATPAPNAFGVPVGKSRELIVFMLTSSADDQGVAMARVWDFLILR
jgi:hypothetical protein